MSFRKVARPSSRDCAPNWRAGCSAWTIALAQGSLADLQARLERLRHTPGGTEMLRLLDRIITERGLVELGLVCR